MSRDAILQAIAEEAEREVEAVLADARQRAAALVADATRAAHDRVMTAIAGAEPEIRAEAAREVNAARVELLHRRAQVSAERLDAVFSAAERRLSALAEGASPRWHRAVGRLAVEAAAATGPLPGLMVRAQDAASVRAALHAAGVDARVRGSRDAAAGVIARSADGRVEVDATLRTRLARARPLLAERLVAILQQDAPAAAGRAVDAATDVPLGAA
jgi:V/A-type H+-transporting ATPase subunit E